MNKKTKIELFIKIVICSMLMINVTHIDITKVYSWTDAEKQAIEQNGGLAHDGWAIYKNIDDYIKGENALAKLRGEEPPYEEMNNENMGASSSNATSQQATQSTNTSTKSATVTTQSKAEQKEAEQKACNHTYVDKVTKPATCTETGTMTSTCSKCGKTVTSTIPKAKHDYEKKITKKATCTEDGEATYTCKNCGDTYTEKIPKTGHKYEKKETLAPTCTETGVMTYVCQNCGDTYTEDIPALGHKEDKGTITKKAGLFTNGEKTYKCTVCGKVTRTEVIQSRYPITYLYIIIGVCAVIVTVVLAMVIHKKRHPLGK